MPTEADKPAAKRQELDYDSISLVPADYCRASCSAEELTVDFGVSGLGSDRDMVKLHTRVMLSPWCAKRLVITMSQLLAGYEKTFGPIVIDQADRVINVEVPQGQEDGRETN